MDRLSGLGAIHSALANRNFRLYCAGNACSYVGTWIQRVAIGWLTWELTHSAFWLGVISMCDLAPSVVLAPLAGAMADRVERIRATKITQSLAMAQAALLAGLTYAGAITIELLVVLSLALGAINAFNQPLRFAIIPSLVGRHDLAAAISLNSLSFNGSRVIGPAIAGGIIVQWGVAPCFAVNAASFLSLLIALWMMRGNPQDRPGKARPIGNLPAEIREGFAYCMRHAGIAPLLIMVLFVAVLGRAYAELLPGFAEEVFERGADGLALLTSSMGVGAVVAGFVMATRGGLAGMTAIVIRGVLVLGLSVLAFTLSPTIWVGMACMVASGYAAITCSVGQQTLLQSAVAPDMRGRAMSLYGMIARAGPSFGALIMGSLHNVIGLRWPVFAGAAACLVLWLWVFRQRDALARSLEADPSGDPENV